MANQPGKGDYYDGTKKGEPKPPQNDSPLDGADMRWWELKGTRCAQSIASTVDTLQKNQAPRIRQMVVNQALYGNRRPNNTQSAARARLLQQQSSARKSNATDNVTQAVVDTAASKVGEMKPRPFFLTSGGDYKQQRRAKRLNKYIDGVFYENKTYSLTPAAFRDAAIDGDGLIHVSVWGGKIRHEVVSSLELWCDEEEAQYGKPRRLFRVLVVDRAELADMFPKSRAAIMAVARARDAVKSQTVSDMVSVAEGWFMGSLGDDGERHNGKHAIALLGGEGHMLQEPAPWDHDFFPFAKLPWCPPATGCGYWSQSLCEQLMGEQIWQNKMLDLIQRSLHLSGVQKILVPVGSKMVKEQFNNEIGSLMMYTGTQKPDFATPQPIHEFFFRAVTENRERMFQRGGYSEMSVSAKKPPGLNSGAAQREFQDVESERHKTTQRLYDDFHLQLAEITIALSIEAANEDKLEAVRVPGRQAFDRIDFKKDLKGLKRSEFTLHCHSISRLPKDPAGQLATIQEFVQAGIVSLRRAVKLIDFPDLEAEVTMLTAQESVIEMVLDAIVDEGEYAPPEPTDDLALAKEMVVQHIQHYRTLGLEPERLDMLRTWSAQVDDLTAMALPAAAPMGQPQAAPMAPPQSDLLPNAPQMARAA